MNGNNQQAVYDALREAGIVFDALEAKGRLVCIRELRALCWKIDAGSVSRALWALHASGIVGATGEGKATRYGLIPGAERPVDKRGGHP